MNSFLQKIGCLFLLVFYLSFFQLSVKAKDVVHISSRRPVLQSQAGIVADVNSEQIYFQKNMHNKLYPASITKVLTGLLAVERGKPDEKIKVTPTVLQTEKDGVAHIGLRPGETLTLDQLLYTMFLASANDSAVVVAEHIAGSTAHFVDLMNEKAKTLGAKESHFSTPNGLPDVHNYTSAYDMALIMRAAAKNTTLMKYMGAQSYTLAANSFRKKPATFTTLHKMMQSASPYYDGDIVAGKTGWETMSKNTLVTVARKNGRELLAVVLKGENARAIYGDTKALLTYGFLQPSASIDSVTSSKTEKSKQAETVNQISGLSQKLLWISVATFSILFLFFVCKFSYFQSFEN